MKRAALVTGGTRGIGLAIADALAEEGYDVAVTSRKPVDELSAALRERFLCLCADNASGEMRRRAIDAVLAHFSRLDLLVNNAGIAPDVRGDLLEMREESMWKVLGVNLVGPFFLTQLAAEAMIRQGGGTIINISSVSAYAVSTERGEYCVSKAGISMMTQLFAARLARENVRVYEIRPGVIRTDMTAGVAEKYDRRIAEGLTPIMRWGEPEDVARAAVALASGAFAFSTGEVVNVDGGFHIARL
jgi:NAD(P)-dependent dehydrogenase (short-subunit alcohol dehydrogenase family)